VGSKVSEEGEKHRKAETWGKDGTDILGAEVARRWKDRERRASMSSGNDSEGCHEEEEESC